MAPEVFMHKHYDKSVDVFSFAIIVQEVCLLAQRSIGSVFSPQLD
jgi:serine/threonine protein kinase